MPHKSFLQIIVIAAVLLITGCAHRTETSDEKQQRVQELGIVLQHLAPDSTPQAAQHLASVAVNTASHLRNDYDVSLAPWLHNMEVNAGMKQRGLCFHYANDLAAALQPQLAPYWQMYRVQARPGEVLEHNAIVISGNGQRWQDGIVLDAWRNAGVLYFGPVMKDKYPWQRKKNTNP